MKKVTRKIIAALIAVAMIISVIVVSPAKEASAATQIAPGNVRCGVGLEHYGSFSVNFPSAGCKLSGLKSKSSNLVVRQTYYSTSTTSAFARVSFYAKKTGTYKIVFKIKNKAGMTLGSTKTVRVHVSETGGIVKSVTLGKTTVKNGDDIYTTANKGKLTVKLNTGYKIKKIEVGKYNSNGEVQYKKVKNGKAIYIGNVGYSYYSDDYETGTYTLSRDLLAYTYVRITYVDTFSTDSSYEYISTVYIVKKATKWKV